MERPGQTDPSNAAASYGSRPPAANASRTSHSRHLTIRTRDGSGQQVIQMDQNDPFMVMQALMGNMLDGRGVQIMLGDQAYGDPGDYVGSERAFDRLITSLMYSIFNCYIS